MSNDARRAYEHGEKPSQADYANGLDKFFSVGDRRLTPNGNGGYTLETWSGSEWVTNSNGDLEIIEFARENERVKKALLLKKVPHPWMPKATQGRRSDPQSLLINDTISQKN